MGRRIVARAFAGYFDAGAYTRLSSCAIVKCTGHLPGPYTIPNVASNVYCVYTNRTPATAMRGLGITGVDFAIECQMDRVAEAVGMNPVELCILNAYRDGDMKAHRRLAKNTALIEYCQVAAGKAGLRLGPEYAAASSLAGGGGERAAIPETVTDQDGRIGERRRQRIAAEPNERGSGRVAAGTASEAVAAAPPQHDDTVLEAERIGHRVSGDDAGSNAARAAGAKPAGTGTARQSAAGSGTLSAKPTLSARCQPSWRVAVPVRHEEALTMAIHQGAALPVPTTSSA